MVTPVLMKEFGWGEAMMGTVLSAFFVGYLFTQPPGGLIADRFDGKGILGFAVLGDQRQPLSLSLRVRFVS